jgi:hypothetical protein
MGNHRIIAFASAVILISLGMLACHSISTPTKAMQTYWYAMKNKDIKAWKSIFPKQRREWREKIAKERNKSPDDLYKEDLDSDYSDVSGMPDKLETRNETISSDGKTATLEVKNPKYDRWVTARFVKEDDGWKLIDSGLAFHSASGYD